MNDHQIVEKPTKKYAKLKQSDFAVVYEFLKGVLVKEDADYAHYKSGWDDAKVAETVSHTKGMSYVIDHHVSHVRRAVFGNFPPRLRANAQGAFPLRERVVKLEIDVQKMMDFLTQRAGFKIGNGHD